MATNTQSNSHDMLLFGKSFITAHNAYLSTSPMLKPHSELQDTETESSFNTGKESHKMSES
jgi:hypothetical protein